MDRYQGPDIRLTKCVTIRNFESEIPAEPPMKWVNCFNVTSTRQPLCKPSDWQSTDVSHVLLNIDIPNQQPYHLPLLILPVHCIYLILFDLRYTVESLTRIHNVMKNVYTLSSYAAKVEGKDQLPPKVLLVGMHAEESNKSEERHLFSQKLNGMLKKKPYEKLIERDGREPFWAVDGGDLCLNGTDRLSQQIQCYKCGFQAEVHRWILCHHELQEKFKDAPCILYRDLEVAAMSSAESLKFEAFLQFLHKYGFVFYHSVEEMEAQVVLLQPQYLCKLFAQVLKLSKDRTRTTIADLLSSVAAYIESNAKYKQWFQRICIDMGLVFEVTKAVTPDFVFLMGLEAGPSCPDRELYSVPPLLVTFKGPGGEKVEEECLLPSHFFAAFVTEFLRTLTQSYRKQRKPNRPVPLPTIANMEQHYVDVCIAGTHVHVVERECCVEIGFQYVEVPGCKDQKAKRKLQKLICFCSHIKSAVTDSADNILQRLKLTESSLCYGFYHLRKTEDGTFDSAFGEYTYMPDEEKWILLCSCCVPGEHTTSPLQDIWFQDEEDFAFDEEVCLKTVTFLEKGNIVNIRKLCEAPPSDLQTYEPPPSDAVSGASNSHFEGALSLPDGPSPSKPSCDPQGPPQTPLNDPQESPCLADCADGASSDPARKISARPVPSDTITAEQVLDHFRAQFIKDVDANAIVLELKHKNIIADGDEREVSQKHDKTQQNQILQDRLRQKCTNEALMTVCEVLIDVRGNPKMSALGADMKSILEGHTKREAHPPPSGGVSGASTSQLEGAHSLLDGPSPSSPPCVPQEPPLNPPNVPQEPPPNPPSVPQEPPPNPPSVPQEPPPNPPSVPQEPPPNQPSVPQEPPPGTPSIPQEPPRNPPSDPQEPPCPAANGADGVSSDPVENVPSDTVTACTTDDKTSSTGCSCSYL